MLSGRGSCVRSAPARCGPAATQVRFHDAEAQLKYPSLSRTLQRHPGTLRGVLWAWACLQLVEAHAWLPLNPCLMTRGAKTCFTTTTCQQKSDRKQHHICTSQSIWIIEDSCTVFKLGAEIILWKPKAHQCNQKPWTEGKFTRADWVSAGQGWYDYWTSDQRTSGILQNNIRRPASVEICF